MIENNYLKENLLYKDGFFIGKENIKIYYKSYEIENSKAIVVISHGLWESSEKYEEFITTLNKNNYSVYIFDHRGHGRSGRLGIDNSQINVENFDYYIEDLKIFLDEIVIPNLNERKLYLFAHSMGGSIGALFLEKYNNYFSKAILNCPMMKIDTENYPQLAAQALAKTMCTLGLGNKYVFGKGPFDSKPNFEGCATSCKKRYDIYFNKQLECDYLQTGGISFNWLNESFKAMNKLLKQDNIDNIKSEMILFQAGKDSFVKPDGHEKFISKAKNCEFIKFEDAKHEIYIERDEIRDKYIKEVLKFYDK